jgi:hypothetical protein
MDESDSDDSDNGKGGLTGLEREQRLAEIAEQEEERRKIAQLKGLMSKSGKRKASSLDGDDDDDESDRAATRRRTKRDQPSAASRRTRKPQASRRSSGSSNRDADGESDYESKRVDPPGELSEYQRMRIGRSNFADYCFYPGVEKFFLGCFVRVVFSQDNVTHENQYRMTQIKCSFHNKITFDYCANLRQLSNQVNLTKLPQRVTRTSCVTYMLSLPMVRKNPSTHW